ncbi:hypothetical protein LINPERHAP1_LOCUS24415, partial [Linum perenne]
TIQHLATKHLPTRIAPTFIHQSHHTHTIHSFTVTDINQAQPTNLCSTDTTHHTITT